MRIVHFTAWALALGLWLGQPVDAHARSRVAGDDNPYPLACLDFSGSWRSDEGQQLDIEQGQCKWLKLRTSYDSHSLVTTIVPDDKVRGISGNRWTGVIRHRWNNRSYATIIETHRTLYFKDRKVTELVLLEKVNENLLLESVHRTTVMNPGESSCAPEPEYGQRVFRLQGGEPQPSPRKGNGK